MAFEKGRPKTGGKKAGTQNKATMEFKEAVNNLIEYATPQMIVWLGQIAENDPNKALDHVFKFAQFGYPLLSRTALTNPEGGALEVKILTGLADAPDNNS